MHAEALSSDQRRAFPKAVRGDPSRGAPDLDRFLSLPDVIRLTTLAKATIYRRMSQGTFPKPITLSRTKVAWSARDIAQWQQDQREAGTAPDCEDGALMITSGEDIAA